MVFTSADLMNMWNGSSWQVGARRMSRMGIGMVKEVEAGVG